MKLVGLLGSIGAIIGLWCVFLSLWGVRNRLVEAMLLMALALMVLTWWAGYP